LIRGMREWDDEIPDRDLHLVPRLRDETFLCFSWSEWDPSPEPWREILRRLAFRNRVVVVPPPLERTEVFGSRYALNGHRRGTDHREDHLTVYRFPRFLPRLYKPGPVAAALHSLRIRSLARVLRRLDGKPPVLYLLHPRFREYIGRLDEKVALYHVLDEYAGYPGADKTHLQEEEDSLLDSVDTVVCASQELQMTKAGPCREVQFLPNGVDFGLLSRAATHPLPTPEELDEISPPRAGFIGKISDELDFRLLRDLALLLPRFSFCFIGPVLVISKANRELCEEWTSLPNVHLIGTKRTFDLPPYVRALDVLLLPYTNSVEGRKRYPVQLQPYFATGKPVVSVPLPAVEEYGDLLHVSSTPEGWADGIHRALDEEEGRRRGRIAVARRHRWERIVLHFERIVTEALRSRSA